MNLSLTDTKRIDIKGHHKIKLLPMCGYELLWIRVIAVIILQDISNYNVAYLKLTQYYMSIISQFLKR